MIQKGTPEPVVILVDGDPVVVSTLRKLFEHEPFELRATANPLRALKWLEEGDARLVLADPDMPAVQASDLIRVVEERFPRTPCVRLSARTMEDEPSPRVATKPWNPLRFERAVLDLLHRRGLVEERPVGQNPAPAAPLRQAMNVLVLHPRTEMPSPLEQALREAGFGTRPA